MPSRPLSPRRTGVASLATLAAVAALSVATPAALTGTASAADAGGAQLAPGVGAPHRSHATAAGSASPSPDTQVFDQSFAQGTVLVANYNQSQVVAVAPDGTQTTVGAGFMGPSGVSLDDATGAVYVADFNASTVWKVAPDGTQTTVGTELLHPEAVLAEPNGDLLISDADNQRVLRVTPDGTQTTLPFTGLMRPYGLAEDADGTVYVADSSGNSVYALTSDGVQTPVGGGFSYPTDVALDSAGDLVVTDSSNNRVVSVAPDGTQTTLAFTDLSDPFGVAVDGHDHVFVANLGAATTYELTPDGEQSTLAPIGGAGVDVTRRSGQVITFTSTAPTEAVPGDDYTVTATGGDSGNPVAFSTGSSDVCSVADNGDGTADVSLDHTGDCVIDADQAGGDDYAPAAQAHQTVTVGQLAQQVSFTSTPGTLRVGGDYTATATGGGSGNPVTFSVEPGSADVCTVSPAGQVHAVHAKACSVVASQEGSGDYAAGSAVQVVHILRAPQLVTFTSHAPRHATVGTSYHAKASSNVAGRPVRISVIGRCSVGWHGVVRFTHRGTCSVFARQVGSGDYKPGHVKQVIAVYPAQQGRGAVHLGASLLG